MSTASQETQVLELIRIALATMAELVPGIFELQNNYDGHGGWKVKFAEGPAYRVALS